MKKVHTVLSMCVCVTRKMDCIVLFFLFLPFFNILKSLKNKLTAVHFYEIESDFFRCYMERLGWKPRAYGSIPNEN